MCCAKMCVFRDIALYKCPESRRTNIATVSKIYFFSDWAETFFSTFWTPRTKKLRKKFVCPSVMFLFVLCLSIKIYHRRSGHSFGSYLYEIWYTCVSMGYLETLKKDFLNFDFFQFLLDFWYFWDLAIFLRWSPDYFQIEVLWFLLAKRTIVRLRY